jgi:prevent-host-death family protein
MTTVTIEEFRAQLDSYLAAAARETVVVTQDGQPWIVLHAAGDNGDVDFAQSPAFWRLIQERRGEQGIPWEEARKQLDLD